MGRLLDEQTLVKIIDNHLNDKNQLDDNITCILEEVPTVEAVPMVHLDVEKSEILDTLDKMQFFLGQRAGRELWNDKPEDIQEKDLENFNRDIEKIKEYLFNVKPVKRGEWIAQDECLTKFMCSVCKGKNHGGHEKFCPECSADMRKKV